jgi:hypothetical protein
VPGRSKKGDFLRLNATSREPDAGIFSHRYYFTDSAQKQQPHHGISSRFTGLLSPSCFFFEVAELHETR